MNILAASKANQKQLEQTNTSKETQRSYLYQQQEFAKYMNARYNAPIMMADITLDDAEAYFHHLLHERGWSVASVNISISAVRKLFHFAERKGWIQNNVMLHIDTLKKQTVERDFLSEMEMKKLILAIDHSLIRLVVLTLAYSGLRISECLNLTLADVDFEKNVIRVINGKGGKNRTVPLAENLADELLLYRDTQRPNVTSDNFFALKKTGSISDKYINRELKIATEKAGIDKKVSCHTLRHSFASSLVRHGTDLPTVAKLLGHSDFRTVTSIYVHKDQSELTSAVNQLSI
ncbi:tyrosine-type recombinase/integrase [Lysinibacillus sp. FSL K6-0057]|uniref:tyrosine-type recombinase/integrase n=1 Tax=Lysinibacillus sp. FSL K6-0057 TaxID=2921411 RepID=UPI00315AC4FB